jgi:monoamine oxidase
MFGMFYDMSSVWSRSNSYSVGTNSETKTEGPTPETRGPSENSPTEGSFILLTTISGKALLWYHAASDSEIVDSCLKTLRLMFGTSAVMEVQGYLVSRWGSEPHVGMSYSYVAVGSTGEDYDVIAETAHGHIHFAGEVSPYFCNYSWRSYDFLAK